MEFFLSFLLNLIRNILFEYPELLNHMKGAINSHDLNDLVENTLT